MNFLRIQAICLFTLALLQVASAFFVLSWALPLFGSPPVLGNGIASASYKLGQIAAQHPDEFKHITWVPEHLRWLFARHSEGVFYALGCAVALLGSATATMLLVCLQISKFHLNSGGVEPSPNSSTPTR